MFRYLSDDYDDNGVPIINAPNIESLALDFLKRFAPKNLDRPPTPIFNILLELIEKHGVIGDLNSDLGYLNNKKILGMIKVSESLTKNEIRIDKSLLKNQSDSRLRFTIAHEIGHLVLHSKKKPSLSSRKNLFIITDLEKFKSKRTLKTPEDFLEYQANNFAASLLMPVPALNKEILNLHKLKGIQIKVNEPMTTDRIFSHDELNGYIEELTKKFSVSKISMGYRLKNLHVESTIDGELDFYRESKEYLYAIDY